MKKALITGGAGFIGSNLAKLLLEKQWKVRIIDDLSSGYLENIASLPVEFIKGNICDVETVESACVDVDVVFHLAASVGRQRSLDYPQLDSQINLIGTVNVLEGMRKQGVPKIVYSSSAAIFGELEMPTIAENHPQNADSPYGVSKLAAEKMVLAYAGIYSIQGVCLRYFNIYGENQHFDFYGNVIPIFAKRINENKSITIYGDGNQTRDFLNVQDVARANYLAATTDVGSDVFNLGSGSTVSILELAHQMNRIAGKDIPIHYEPERPADVKHCKANTSKAARVLNFEAQVALTEGLVSYMKWYQNTTRE